MKPLRFTRAAWLAACAASALASAADPPPSAPPPPEADPDAELLEFLGSEDAADDVWTHFLAWLETAADPQRESPAPKAEGETDE